MALHGIRDTFGWHGAIIKANAETMCLRIYFDRNGRVPPYFTVTVTANVSIGSAPVSHGRW